MWRWSFLTFNIGVNVISMAIRILSLFPMTCGQQVVFVCCHCTLRHYARVAPLPCARRLCLSPASISLASASWAHLLCLQTFSKFAIHYFSSTFSPQETRSATQSAPPDGSPAVVRRLPNEIETGAGALLAMRVLGEKAKHSPRDCALPRFRCSFHASARRDLRLALI